MSSFTKEQFDEEKEGIKKGNVDGIANMTETIKYLIPNGVSEAYKTGYAYGYENAHSNNARNRPLVELDMHELKKLPHTGSSILDKKLQSEFIDLYPDPYDLPIDNDNDIGGKSKRGRKSKRTRKSKGGRKSKKSKRTRKSKKSKK